jgi:Secretion system C-terminal sorting domain
LPVTITSVKAYQQASNIEVEWKVSNQLSVNNYEIQKSTDGRTFVTIGSKLAVNNTQLENTYTFTDVQVVSGVNYYRIKSVDNSGAFKYSIIVKVNIGNFVKSVTVWPNPIQGNSMNLQFVNEAAGNYNVQLTNILGQVVFSKQINHAGGSATQTVSLPKGLISGGYQMQVIAPDNTTQVQKVIINSIN